MQGAADEARVLQSAILGSRLADSKDDEDDDEEELSAQMREKVVIRDPYVFQKATPEGNATPEASFKKQASSPAPAPAGAAANEKMFPGLKRGFFTTDKKTKPKRAIPLAQAAADEEDLTDDDDDDDDDIDADEVERANGKYPGLVQP
jgi:hypothetical protein